MVGITGAIIGSAVIGAAGSAAGSAQAAKGQKAAARVQAQQFAETKKLLTPYTSAGEGALAKYNTALGLSGREEQQKFYDDFEFDPGFQAASKAGADTVDDRYRLSGSSGGNVRAALYDYGQRNLLSAYQTRLSQLGGLVDTGRQAAGSLAGAGQSSANAQGAALANAGLLQGRMINGPANAISGGFSNYGQSIEFDQAMRAGRIGANNADRYFD
jgi:hypothetical protein